MPRGSAAYPLSLTNTIPADRSTHLAHVMIEFGRATLAWCYAAPPMARRQYRLLCALYEAKDLNSNQTHTIMRKGMLLTTQRHRIRRTARYLSLKKLLGPNLKLLSRQERKIASALVQQGHSHLFTTWPPPGEPHANLQELDQALRCHALVSTSEPKFFSRACRHQRCREAPLAEDCSNGPGGRS